MKGACRQRDSRQGRPHLLGSRLCIQTGDPDVKLPYVLAAGVSLAMPLTAALAAETSSASAPVTTPATA